MKNSSFIIGLLATSGFWGAHQIQCATGEQIAQGSGSVVIRDVRSTPLEVVLRISVENRLPLGIVFGTQPLLCAERATVNISAANFSDALSQAVAGTGYKVTIENNVYKLTGPDTTSHDTKLLDYRFERFSATDTTMSHAGALLSGYIKTVAEGARAFAVDTLESASPEVINVKMQSATTEEIANRIVSLGDKGIWAFRPAQDEFPTLANSDHIQVYGYKDDQAQIEALTCESPQK
jgi:hypothetical protein